MNSELIGNENGLVAYYPFSRGLVGINNTGLTTLTNAATTGATYNGTLTNFSLTGNTSNWTSPGGVTTGSTYSTPIAPEINMKAGSTSIADGDATPSLSDLTNFGPAKTGSTLAYTYTIENTGTAALTVNGIAMSGTNSGEFAVSGISLPATVAIGASTTFVVTFTAGTTGIRTATVTVNSTDCDEAAYDFALQATATSTSGVRGNMLSFSGAGQVATVNASNSLDITGALTLSAWIYPQSTGGYQNVMLKGGYGYGLILDAAGHIGYWGNSSVSNCLFSTSMVTFGAWNHVAAVVTAGSSLKLYLNGVEVGSSTAAGHTTINIGSTGSALYIGTQATCGCNYFSGYMDEVQVWKTALTQAQIRENMHLTLIGTETNLVSYYQFNEASGDATDAISSNTGTLTGATRVASTLSVSAGTTSRQTVSGPGAATFGNVTIGFTAMSGAGANEEFEVSQQYATAYNNVSGIPGSALHHWVVRQFGVQMFSYNTLTVVLPAQHTISAGDAATPANFKLYKRSTNSGAAWTEIGTATSATIATNTVVFSVSPTQTSFSEFAVGSSGSTFPVTLTSFAAERIGPNEVLLNWSTATETNNAGFEVQQSVDNNDFKAVAFVAGAGNSSTPLAYESRVSNARAAYYRLRQTDHDGAFSYSETRFVEAAPDAEMYFAPNPVQGLLHLHGNIPAGSYAHLTIYSLDGRLLLSSSSPDVEAAANAAIANFAPGLYLFRLWIDGQEAILQQMAIE